jgi:hypothetical protein
MVANNFGKSRPRRIEMLEYLSSVIHKINPTARLQHTRAPKTGEADCYIFPNIKKCRPCVKVRS